MLRARGQAEQDAKALPEWPPFLIVIDVGPQHRDLRRLYRHRKALRAVPGYQQVFRIRLPELAREEVRARLKTIWLDPLSLDPSRHAAKVTREIADRLAKLGRSLEKDGHGAEQVALFLMRSLFTMFARHTRRSAKGQSFREAAARLARQAAHLRADYARPLGQHGQGWVFARARRRHPAL